MRKIAVLIPLAVIAAGVIIVLAEIPFEDRRSEVGEYYLREGREQTGAVNIVTAVVVGYRGFDTLGEVAILTATFIALRQDDAERLLAWSTIAQAGYILVGRAFGTGLSVAGGLPHFLNHAVFKALLFLAVGAVEFRTGGVRDLNSLGGLSGRMPFTTAAAVILFLPLGGPPPFRESGGLLAILCLMLLAPLGIALSGGAAGVTSPWPRSGRR